MELSPDGIVLHDGRKTVFANKAAMNILGAKAQNQVIGVPISKFVHPKHWGKVKERIKKEKVGKDAPLREEKFVRVDGRIIDVSVAGRPVAIDGVSLIQVVFRDISEQKASANKIKESEEKLRTISENIGDAIFAKGKDRCFTFVNPAAVQMMGLPQKKIIGSRAEDVFSPHDAAVIKYVDDKNFQGHQVNEIKTLKLGGNKRNLHTVQSPIFDNKHNVIGITGVVRDVTESKKIEEALMNSEERYRIITAQTKHLIYDYDINTGKIKWDGAVNSVLKHSLNYMNSQIDFDGWVKMIHPDDRKETIRLLNEAQKKCCNFYDQYRFKTKGGVYIYVEHSGLFLPDKDGRPYRMLGTMSDISERRAIDKMKSEFVSMASHQLLTPLSDIKWLITELTGLAGDHCSTEQTNKLNQIRKSNTKMVELVKDLLSVSRIESGTNFILEYSTFNFSSMIKEVLKQYKSLISAKNLKVRLSFKGESCRCEADQKKLEQVVTNIFSNSVKFSKKGGQINIDCECGIKKIHCKVQDFGMGIPKKDHKKVFTKFFRADNATMSDTEGTGLGLYIAKAIVDAHGGSIWFDSQENKGAQFHFTFNKKPFK
ncbi:hypothetical protein COT97_05265 [Candidatus Falkowbacteria bacterium CG10_big_fil_rev_8_21_14_0_10_39_11]|uniref:histidine kinase n=1 Tax=Candidatus Falkowbacteria bacterium CG10_big_fil_rev_8_21_14_0_10_39_11 TaxID=1974565 RepID=A0A2H0V3K3_9BACT|nr:MAG: hypothetical protein COT97_05265 [Candidatus Falkowbacteria bacterium CG10_big_fil_rev_8_21_14_0_10_39_11]